ncbi:hypothetical protein NUW58_g9328 [Xylaria curta]|uniref:Uncharacterized protein n=1 Tax=Xylaria curta TaxID=42375 RepID=A0ACC1MYZ3_9PEZI|nr:hypothetical protein NUW58_g9328 [Xylaria curta]
MRTQNPPPGSPSSESDRPIADEDVSIQTLSVGSTTSTSPYHISFPAIHGDIQSSNQASLPHLPAHAQSHHSTAEGADESEATDEEGNDDYSMVDVEEGGALLNDMDMEETSHQPPVSPLQGTQPESVTANASTNTPDSQPFIPTAAGPPAGPAVINTLLPTLEQNVDEPECPSNPFGRPMGF